MQVRVYIMENLCVFRSGVVARVLKLEGGGGGGDRTNAKDAKFPEELRSMLPKKFSILRVFKTLFLAFSLI